MASKYKKERVQTISSTPQEMDAWEALRREPGLMGRLARRGKRMKPSYVGGRRAFYNPNEDRAKEATRPFAGARDAIDRAYQGRRGSSGGGSAAKGQGSGMERDGGGWGPPAKTPEQIEAERKAAAKKKYDADKKAATEKYEKEKSGRDRSKYTEGTMRDAEGRTMEDRGVMTDAEGRVEGDEGFDFETAEMKGGYDESTGKMDTEGSFEGYRGDYKDLRGRADYSETRDDLEGYQDEADKLRGEAKGKYAGYESDIAGQPDYASKVADMAADQEKTGTKAQQDLAALSTGIDTSTTEGKKALTDAAGKMGIAAGDIKDYESKVGEFAQAGQDAAGRGEAAGLRGEAAGLAGATAITGAAGQGMTQAQQAQQAMGTASGKLGDMATQAQDTGALMKDRGLFAGQIEAKRKAGEKGKLANLRRSMAAAGSSPEEIARAEAAASGGSQAGREDALAASMAAMQSGQSQLGQAAGLTGQQAQIAAQSGALGMQGAGMGLQGAQAAGQMGMAGAGMGMQGAQMGMQGAQMGMQGAGQQAGMAGQRATLAGQQGAMGLQGAQLGLAGAGQKAQNIQAGAGQAMQGQQGAMQGYGAAQGLGIGKTQAAAGMYGTGVGAQQNLMSTGAQLAGQQQSSLQGEIAQQAGLTGQMAGMTEAQLQDVVAQQNAAQQKDLAERGLLMQGQANAANRPQGPSQMQQLMGVAQTVAPIAMMAMSDKKAKKNIRSAKDKDLMGPKQIDGFLNDLYAYQYNYKNAGHGTGKQVGVMAQDLEKTQLGKQMVEKTPQGKKINAAKGLGLAMASQARLNQRLNSIGA